MRVRWFCCYSQGSPCTARGLWNQSSKYLFEKLGHGWKGSHFSLSGGRKQHFNTLREPINYNKKLYKDAGEKDGIMESCKGKNSVTSFK